MTTEQQKPSTFLARLEEIVDLAGFELRQVNEMFVSTDREGAPKGMTINLQVFVPSESGASPSKARRKSA